MPELIFKILLGIALFAFANGMALGLYIDFLGRLKL